MGLNRILSLFVAIGYLIVAILISNDSIFLIVVLIVFALALIWFGDDIGGYTGLSSSGIGITRSSPGCAIQCLGWFFLLGPFIYLVIKHLL